MEILYIAKREQMSRLHFKETECCKLWYAGVEIYRIMTSDIFLHHCNLKAIFQVWEWFIFMLLHFYVKFVNNLLSHTSVYGVYWSMFYPCCCFLFNYYWKWFSSISFVWIYLLSAILLYAYATELLSYMIVNLISRGDTQCVLISKRDLFIYSENVFVQVLYIIVWANFVRYLHVVCTR